MSEIDNINAIRFQKINLSKKELKKQASQDENGIEFYDFSNPKAESLGRSQVSTPDNIEGDVKFMMKNPEFVKQANIFFDNAYDIFKSKNEERAYEKAAQMTQAYKDEFLVLKKRK